MEEDLTRYQYVGEEESLNSAETKPKTITLRTDGPVAQGELDEFLRSVLPQCWRMKGFLPLDTGWHRVDVVGTHIDYKPCEARPVGELVIISRIGPAIIRPLMEQWKTHVSAEMTLKN